MKTRLLLPFAGYAVIAIVFSRSPIVPMSAQGQPRGTIQGHVKLTGPAPANALIRMGADPSCLKINQGKRVIQETVLRAADGGLANVFVNLTGTFPKSGPPAATVVIDQQGCVYHPRVQGVQVGQTLEVKNSDQTLHNIHSMSTRGQEFNAGQPQAGMVFKYQMRTDEVMLHVKCDVHSWMTGYLGVLPHPYYAVTDTAGSFTIPNVPAGKQTIQVWHERYGPLTQTVDVKAGATTTADFAYTGDEKYTPSAFLEDVTVPPGTTAIRLTAAR